MKTAVFSQGLQRVWISIVVMDSSPASYWRSICHTAGLRRPSFISDFSDLRTELNQEEIDCLLISIPRSGFSTAGRTVKAIRNGQLGRDPFLPILIASDPPGGEEMRILAGCGVDAVLVRPLSVGKICDRLRLLTTQRRPFVVTADYIGPDRRAAPRTAAIEAPLMEVPNALADRILANVQVKSRTAARQAAWGEVMRQRLTRYAENMRLLGGRSFPPALKGDLNAEVLEDMRRLARIAEDAWKRLEREAGAEPLARQIGDVALRMRSFVQAPNEAPRDLLAHLQADLGHSASGLAAFLSGAVAEPPRA
ncbi:hypothetical protein [Oleispirillum naphthae]|uniref:hypothetical protein n=1 Tax=Oleispirillum naphthae TaxID=2838853 RepID=UPI00308231A0